MPESISAAIGPSAFFDTEALSLLFEAVQEAVIITSPNLDAPGPTILYVNSACERMTGYSRGELVGESPRILQGPKTRRAEMERMRSDLARTGTFEGEATNYRKDGVAFTLSWAIVPIRDEFGQIANWLSVQRDKTAERHTRSLLSEAEEAQRDLAGVPRSPPREGRATLRWPTLNSTR